MLYDESLSSVTINNQQPSAVSALKKNYIIYANKTTQIYAGVHGMVDRPDLDFGDFIVWVRVPSPVP